MCTLHNYIKSVDILWKNWIVYSERNVVVKLPLLRAMFVYIVEFTDKVIFSMLNMPFLKHAIEEKWSSKWLLSPYLAHLEGEFQVAIYDTF